jgi:Zn-dependent protease with chaperone function
MGKREERLKELKDLYRCWETEDLMKTVTIDKAQYEPIAFDLMIQEINTRNLGGEDIKKFPETFSRQKLIEWSHNFVLEQMRIGVEKRTIIKNLLKNGMDVKEALQLVETVHAQILKARKEEAERESGRSGPFKDTKKDIRSLVALIFLPGLYFCLLLSAVVSLLGAGMLIYIIFKLASDSGLIPIGIMIFIAIGGFVGVGISFRAGCSAIKKATVYCHAITITEEQAPELFKTIQNLCNEMWAPTPKTIVLELGTNAFVTDAKVVSFDGRYDSRTLCLGTSLLRVLTKDEFRAIVAHELAHFTGNDVVYSKLFYSVYRGTLTALNSMAMLGQVEGEGSMWARIPLIVPMWVLRIYFKVFSRIERSINRIREFRADSVGAKMSTTSSMASALVKVHTYRLLWDQNTEGWMFEALNENKVISNLSDLFVKVFTPQESLLKKVAQDASSHITHPTDAPRGGEYDYPRQMIKLNQLRLVQISIIKAR